MAKFPLFRESKLNLRHWMKLLNGGLTFGDNHSDVDVSNVEDGNFLAYSASSRKWMPGTIAESVSTGEGDSSVANIFYCNTATLSGGGSYSTTTRIEESIEEYVDGMRFVFRVDTTNTASPVTLDIDGLPSKEIKKKNNVALAIGDVVDNWIFEVIYRSAADNFEIIATQSLSADHIVSGTLADARIPNLDASKTTTGAFADARISQSSVNQHLGRSRMFVYRNSSQSIGNLGTWDTVEFNSKDYDVDGAYNSTGAGADQWIFKPPQDGLYLFVAAVSWATDSTGYRAVRIHEQVGGVTYAQTLDANSGAVLANKQCVSVLAEADTADEWVVDVRNTASANLNVGGSRQTHFAAVLIKEL